MVAIRIALSIGILCSFPPLCLGMPLSIAETPGAIAQNNTSSAAKESFDRGVALFQEGTQTSLKAAIETWEEALQLYRQVGDRPGEAETLLGLGLVYNLLGNRQQAIDSYKQAIPVYQAARDKGGEALSLYRIGKINFNLGDYQRSLDYYKQALPIYRAIADNSGIARTFNDMGAVYEPLGEYQRSLDHYNQALSFWRKANNANGEATTLNNIGLIYDTLGEYDRSLDYYNRALPLYEAAENKTGIARVRNNIGLYYDASDKQEQALESYNLALALWQELGDIRGQATTLNNIGFSYAKLQRLNTALDSYNQALPLWQELGDIRGEAATLSNIGFVYANLGQFNQALNYYNQALDIREQIGDRAKQALTLYRVAQTERNKGNLDEAVSQIETALDIIEDLRVNVTSQDLRTSFFASKQEYYEFYIDLLMQLHKTRPKQRYDARALQARERASARSLLDILSYATTDIRSGIDPQLLQRQNQLQQKFAALEKRRIQIFSGQHTAEQAKGIKQEIENLIEEYRALQANIQATSPRYAALTQPQPLTVKEIQKKVLDKDTLLLSYSLGEERSYLWAVTSRDLKSYELPGREAIENAARRFRNSIIAPTQRIRQQRAIQAADRLYEMILAPVADQLEDKRLLILGDGALQYVPFAALPARATVESNGYVPLVVEHEIVTLPSASTMGILRREVGDRPPASKTLAVLADPVFGQNDDRLNSSTRENTWSLAPELERSARESGVFFDRLPFTQQEAEQILALVPTAQRRYGSGFSANRDFATSNQLSEYRILHFATHGLLNSQNPELSGLVLSLVDEVGNPQNGFLRLHDIFNLNLPAELVVLSACETGLGKEIRGEGLVGLTRGFMYAGAARIVVSLWSVDDRATSLLMVDFYQQMLEKGLSPAAALRQAQIQMWKQQEWKIPYYWAAFTLQGEWQ